MFVEWLSPISFLSMKKKFPRAHIEKAKGNEETNYKYCSKDGKFRTNIVPKLKAKTPAENRAAVAALCLKVYETTVWKSWQKEVIDLVRGDPDPRAINWYWDSEGNIGKSYLVKYLCLTMSVIVCDGKKNDIFNQVNEVVSAGIVPRLIVLDLPRSMEDRVAWGVIEQLKNGCIYSGKYEGGMCIYPVPHVVCFANFEPDRESMSADRWKVSNLRAREPTADALASRTPGSPGESQEFAM